MLNQLAKVFCRGKEENEQLKELARKKKQKREKEAESAAAAAGREGASQIKSRSVAHTQRDSTDSLHHHWSSWPSLCHALAGPGL